MADLRPILLVEDNPKDIELTLAALAKCQLANSIVLTRDGAEALDYIYRRGAHADRYPGDPAVVLLDLKLPKVDGLEVLERLKGDADHRQIPVVMLTSSREESDLVRSYELGVNAFVVKPVDFNAFFEAIQDLGMFWGVLNEPPPRGRHGS
ncbi:CheY-like chemotaxis protein [Povalibacter uvarum]|uniref:CheY-like chemotaxis protein n=1 Tax=Povalibacter uvarum TaxID=732238 RepID=A0A841HK48_9GAMM|nr:response regulator [Povalibacter uvarum]MBB6092954.1 CheY-like chemotaxis protein [Povalibacter uvarum]